MTVVDSQEYTVLVSEGEWSDWESVVRSAKIFDLIEIDRNGVYQHWVMYLSKGFIVHVTQVDGRTEGDKAEKRVDTLKAIAREDKCRINNLRDAAKAKGLDVNSNYEIYKLIEDVAGFDHELVNLPKNHYKIMPYNVYSINCEYYATGWKYGKGFSLQIETKLDAFKQGKIPPEVMKASAITAEEIIQNTLESPRTKKKSGVFGIGIGSLMARDR